MAKDKVKPGDWIGRIGELYEEGKDNINSITVYPGEEGLHTRAVEVLMEIRDIACGELINALTWHKPSHRPEPSEEDETFSVTVMAYSHRMGAGDVAWFDFKHDKMEAKQGTLGI